MDDKMPNFKVKKCEICGKEYLPTGKCSKYCPECAKENKREYHRQYSYIFRERQGRPVHVGKGGSNKKFTEHAQYRNGIGNFNRLKKELYAEVTNCQMCGRDLTNLGRYEKCVHHIDHDRTHNTKENLIVICKRCHQLHHHCEESLPQFRKVQRLSAKTE